MFSGSPSSTYRRHCPRLITNRKWKWTSPDRKCRRYVHWTRRPRNHGFRLRNFVYIWSGFYVISTSGFPAAIFDFLNSYYDCVCPLWCTGAPSTEIFTWTDKTFLFNSAFLRHHRYSGFSFSIIYFRLIGAWPEVGIYPIVKITPENVGVAAGILFLCGLELEIPWGCFSTPRLSLTYVEKRLPI